MTLEKGWYLINDEEQFLFAANEVWKAYWKQHDAALIHKAREDVLVELIEWLEPQNLTRLKQKTYRKLQSLRAQQGGDKE